MALTIAEPGVFEATRQSEHPPFIKLLQSTTTCLQTMAALEGKTNMDTLKELSAECKRWKRSAHTRYKVKGTSLHGCTEHTHSTLDSCETLQQT